MSTSKAASMLPSTSTKRQTLSASTTSAKPVAKPLSPGTKAFLRQMVDNLNTHNPDAPKGRLRKA